VSIVPTTYDEWKHCITVSCNIPLTPDYVQERIVELSDTSNYHTQKYIERWGTRQHAKTLGWFKQAAAELSGGVA